MFTKYGICCHKNEFKLLIIQVEFESNTQHAKWKPMILIFESNLIAIIYAVVKIQQGYNSVLSLPDHF